MKIETIWCPFLDSFLLEAGKTATAGHREIKRSRGWRPVKFPFGWIGRMSFVNPFSNKLLDKYISAFKARHWLLGFF